MKKVSVFIDGYNLYHAIDALKKPYLKWADVNKLCCNFINPSIEQIIRVNFFTALPEHKSKEVQDRYKAFTSAINHFGAEIVEGKFKRKLVTYHSSDGKKYTRTSHEEKESDVNIALAILEDSFEKTSDKLLVLTNDSDIAPAIRLARKKNPELKINVITPPLIKTKRANYDLVDACGDINKNKKGQVFYKTRMIKESHLVTSLMPDEIETANGKKIIIPDEYRKV